MRATEVLGANPSFNDTATDESKRSIGGESYTLFYSPILVNRTFQRRGHDLNGPWSLSVDRLVDINWANGSWVHNECPEDMVATDGGDCTDLAVNAKNGSLIDSLAIFDDEDDIDAGPTSLLSQTVVTMYDVSIRLRCGTYCNITQKHIEDKVDYCKLENIT